MTIVGENNTLTLEKDYTGINKKKSIRKAKLHKQG